MRISTSPLSVGHAEPDDHHPGRPITGRTVLIWLVGFFGVVFAVNFFMARVAISSFGGVETESSYQAGLTYTKESRAAAAQDALHWKVEAHVEPGRLDVTARDAEGRPLTDVTLVAALHHPTDRRRDVTLAPVPADAGHWRVTDDVTSGQWELVLEFERDGVRVFRSTNRIVVR